MKAITLTISLALAVFLGFKGFPAYGQSAPPAPPISQSRPKSPADTPRDGPISISADHMTANDNSKVVTFTGRVIARQDDLVISCQIMRVHYQPRQAPADSKTPSAAATSADAADAADSADSAGSLDPAGPASQESPKSESPAFSGGQEIERVECEGDVKIHQGDRLAVGQKALYLARAIPRRLILTGDARVWQGRNAVTGHEVTYFLDENRSQVESQNDSRVKAYYERSSPKGRP
jgi:lipopolysaccharide export system protein LptA